MFRRAASNIILGVSTGRGSVGGHISVYCAIREASVELQNVSKQEQVHTDNNGEQKIASIFHLEHNSMVRRRIPQS